MKLPNIKTDKLITGILVLLTFNTASSILAQTTNSIPANLFLTDDGFLFWHRPSGEVVINLKRIQEAEKSPESKPADQDPEGHWGQPTHGFQLSLRFQKEVYTNGETIAATMLMRNVTNESLTYLGPTYVMAEKNGNVLKRKNDTGLMKITMSPETTLFPQTQNKYYEILNQSYDLQESGEYIFQAECKQPKVVSMKVSILITNAAW